MKVRWQWIPASLVMIVVLTWAFVDFGRDRAVQRESARIEREAADSLLAEKLSGLRYFHTPVSGISEQGGPWIGLTEAKSQLALIAKERGLTPEKVRDLEQLIEQMADSNPSRAIGGARLKLNGLNLTLDRL